MQPSYQPQNISHIIAVASGKGGVGKSTTATYLARELSLLGKDVGLLDMDILGPSITTITGAQKLHSKTTSKSGKDTTILIPPKIQGIKVASAGMLQDPHKASILRGPMVSRFALELLSSISWGKLDYLVLDYPPGTGDIPLSLAQNLTNAYACIVTTPQKLASSEAAKTIDMFHQLSVPILGIIETMSYFDADKRYYLFGKGGGEMLSKTYHLPLLAQIPFTIPCGEQTNLGKALEDVDEKVSRAYNLACKAILDLQTSATTLNGGLKSTSALSLKWDN